jgi:hypothetical protein
MAQLDEDLIYAVCRQIEQTERRSVWLSVSRVRKTWRSAATPLLYRSIDFAARKPKSSFHHFVRTIAERPSLAQHVNALHFCRMQMLPSRRGRGGYDIPATWSDALKVLKVPEGFRQWLERDLGRGGSKAYAAKSVLLLLLCNNLSRLILTDIDLFDPNSRLPLFVVLDWACSGSSSVLQSLTSITVDGAGHIKPEKLAVLLQLPKLRKLVTYNLAVDVSTKLLWDDSLHSRSICKFQYSAIPSHVWRNSDFLVGLLMALPCMEDLTLSIQLPNEDRFEDRMIWNDLCNALCEHAQQLKSLGIEASVGWPNGSSVHIVEGTSLKPLTSLVNLRMRCDFLSSYTPIDWDDRNHVDNRGAYPEGDHLVQYISDMLPTSLQHLHLDEMAPGTDSYELPMQDVQLMHFLADSSFAALQTFAFPVDQLGGQMKDCGAHYPSVPDKLKRLAEEKSMDVWAWSPDNPAYYCLEKRSHESTRPQNYSGPPSGPFIYE